MTIPRPVSLIVALALAVQWLPCVALARSHARTVSVRVRFLATSTSFRSVYAGNEDIYLTALTFGHHPFGEPVIALVIDEYAFYKGPISQTVLVSPKGAQFRMYPDPSCKREYAEIPLRTAPGDPSAALPDRLRYSPQLPIPVKPTQILPCYRIVR